MTGIALGTVGTFANLSQGYPWVPETALCRKTVDGRDAGNVFVAKVVTPVETFGFRELALAGPDGEKVVRGNVRTAFHVPGMFDPRYTEIIEVPLEDDAVRWMADAEMELEIRMEGEGAWIRLPPGSELAKAVQEYARAWLRNPPAPGNAK